MPNWVTAKLKIEGRDSAKVMQSLLTKNEENEIEFDFNKIKPMPSELNIISGSITDHCIDIYLSSINPDNDEINNGRKTSPMVFSGIKNLANSEKVFAKFKGEYTKEMISELIKNYQEKEFKELKDFIEYGRKALANIINHDAVSWYGWCTKNWGTKWNACNNIYNENTPSEICFDTAWSDVRGLMLELSKLFPKNTFVYEYSEEQLGLYTGIATFKNGEVIEDIEFEDCSKEAYEKAFELWGEDLKEHYKFNKKKNTYEHIDNSGEMD